MNVEIGKLRPEYLFGLVMLIVAIPNISFAAEFGNTMSWIISAVMVCSGLAMIVYPNKTPMKTIGIYALFTGTVAILSQIVGLTDSSDLVFVESFVMVCLNLIVITNGIFCIRGIFRNSGMMLIIAVLQLVEYAAVDIYCLHIGADFWELIQVSATTTIPQILMYIIFIYMLTRPGVIERNDQWLIKHDMRDVMTSVSIDADSEIERRDMRRICVCIGRIDQWDRTDVDEITVAESTANIWCPKKEKITMVLQKRADGSMYLMTANDTGGSFVTGQCIRARSIVPSDGTLDDCRYVRIYGDTGQLLNIKVSDAEHREFRDEIGKKIKGIIGRHGDAEDVKE
jgi:hypothetical protein